MAAQLALTQAVKLHQIQCVVTAARRGSFRRAAAALNLQQSSVSRCVQELEERLGAPLFRRGPGGVEVTEVGARFLADAEPALDQLSRAAVLARVAGDEARNTVRIGAVPIPGSGLLPELLQAFTVTWPKHRIALHEAPSSETLLGLHAGALDLAVVLKAPSGALGAEAIHLWQDPFVLAAPSEALQPLGKVSWREVGPGGLILPSGEVGDLIAAKLGSVFGAEFSGAICRASPETALRLVAMRQGRAVVTLGVRGLAPSGVSFRPIADEGIAMSAVRMKRNEKPALRRLLSLLPAVKDQLQA